MGSSLITNMLKSSATISKVLTIHAESVTPDVSVIVNTFLKSQTDLGFMLFDDEKRQNFSQKSTSLLASGTPTILGPMVGVTLGMVVDVECSFKSLMQGFDDRFVSHADPDNYLPANVGAVGFSPSLDSGVTFTIKETGDVSNVHRLVANEKVVNSVDTQTGQYRAKQEGANLPGVCNEHVPPAKAKMCSELGRNAETSMETFEGRNVSTNGSLHYGLTDCNTDYIHFRPHLDRNFVPIGGERQAVNQDAVVKLIGWAGNLTMSGSMFQGVLIA